MDALYENDPCTQDIIRNIVFDKYDRTLLGSRLIPELIREKSISTDIIVVHQHVLEKNILSNLSPIIPQDCNEVNKEEFDPSANIQQDAIDAARKALEAPVDKFSLPVQERDEISNLEKCAIDGCPGRDCTKKFKNCPSATVHALCSRAFLGYTPP